MLCLAVAAPKGAHKTINPLTFSTARGLWDCGIKFLTLDLGNLSKTKTQKQKRLLQQSLFPSPFRQALIPPCPKVHLKLKPHVLPDRCCSQENLQTNNRSSLIFKQGAGYKIAAITSLQSTRKP
jgi:hypothetical protein